MDEGERFCRVCRAGEEPGAPLYKPCKCSGTISWIHQDCLESWLSVSRGHKCELCKHPFKWEKVYAAQAPSQLPPTLIVRHLILTGFTVLHYFIRFIFVAFIWLGFMPYSILWTWRGLFHLAKGWGISWNAAIQEIDWSAVGVASLFLPPAALQVESNSTSSAVPSRSIDSTLAATTNFTLDLSDLIKKGKEIVTLNRNVNGTIVKSSLNPKIDSLEEAARELLISIASKGVNAISQATRKSTNASPIPVESTVRNVTLPFWMPHSAILEKYAPSIYSGIARQWNAHSGVLSTMAKDAFAGQIIVCSVIVSFIAVFLLREWIMANQPHVAAAVEQDGQQQIQAEAQRRQDQLEEVARVLGELQDRMEANAPVLAQEQEQEQEDAETEQLLPTPLLNDSPQDMLQAPEGLRHRHRHASAPPRHDEDGEESAGPIDVGTATPRARSASPFVSRMPPSQDLRSSRASTPQTLYNDAAAQAISHTGEEDDYGVRSEAESEPEPDSETQVEAEVPAGELAPALQPVQPAAAEVVLPAPAVAGLAAAAAAPPRPARVHRPRPRPQVRAGDDEISDTDSEDDNPFVPRPRRGINGAAAPGNAGAPPVAAAGDGDEVFFEADLFGIFEAVGMQGPVLALLQNVALVTLLIATLLAITVWIPLMVGKTVTATNAQKLLLLPLNVVRYFTDPIADASVSLFRKSSVESVTPDQASYTSRVGEIVSASRGLAARLAGSRSQPVHAETWLTRSRGIVGHQVEAIKTYIADTAVQKLQDVKHTWHTMAVGDSQLDRGLCVALGYVVIIVGAGLYLRHTQSGPVRDASAAVREAIRQHLTLAKAASFFFVEIIIFPTICGFLMNMATLPLIPGATISTRINYCLRAPASAIFLTWLAGTNFMFSFAQAISVVRKCIRKGVLYFIRDPSDPDANPLRDILETPTLQQAKKITRSLFVYGGIILTCFGFFPWLSRFVNFGIFPLRWDLTQPISTVPIDLLFMLLVAPWTTGNMKTKRPIRKLVTKWCRMTAHQLRLSSFMLGKRRLDEEGTHIRRTWRAWLLLKRAPIPASFATGKQRSSSSRITFPAVNHQVTCTAVNSPVGLDAACTDVEVVFQTDGGFARVVAADNVKIVAGKMFVRLKPDGTAETEEGLEAIKAQMEKGINDETKFTTVYIPPHFKARILLFIYLLWLVGSIAIFLTATTPLLLGRLIIDCTIGRPLHDAYSMLIGLNVLILSRRLYNRISRPMRTLRRYRRGLSKYALGAHPISVIAPVLAKQGSHLALLGINGGIILPLLAGLAVHLYVFMPFEGILTDLKATSGIPTISLSMSWAYGLLYMSLACSFSKVIRQNWLSTMLQQVKTDGLARTAPLINKRIIQIELRLLLLLLLPISVTFSHNLILRLFGRLPPGSSISSRSASIHENNSDIERLVSATTNAQAYVFRGALLSVTVISLAFILAKPIKKLSSKWLARVWESEYVIQRKLKNIDDTEPQQVVAASTSTASTSAVASTRAREGTPFSDGESRVHSDEDGDSDDGGDVGVAAAEPQHQDWPQPQDWPQQQDWPVWYA